MEKLSLRWKIYIVGLIPFCFYLLAMMFSINDNYSLYQEANSLKIKMKVIEAASAVVHESQKERGMSAGYFNGSVKLKSLNDQYSFNDKKQAKLREVVKNSTFEEPYKNEIIAELDKYRSLREKVTAKSIPLDQILRNYQKIIRYRA